MQSYGVPDWVFRQGSCYLCSHSPAFLEMKIIPSFYLSPLPLLNSYFPAPIPPHCKIPVKWGKFNQILKKPQHPETKRTLSYNNTQVLSYKVSLFRCSRIIFLRRYCQISKAVLREPYTACMLWICKLFSSRLHIKKRPCFKVPWRSKHIRTEF